MVSFRWGVTRIADGEHSAKRATRRRPVRVSPGALILGLHTARIPTVGVDVEELARDPEGLSPADLRSLAREAALAALGREPEAPKRLP